MMSVIAIEVCTAVGCIATLNVGRMPAKMSKCVLWVGLGAIDQEHKALKHWLIIM